MKIIQEYDQCFVIDLNEIIEQWIWYKWKSLSRFKYYIFYVNRLLKKDLFINLDAKIFF
jgi:hypothetical protein